MESSTVRMRYKNKSTCHNVYQSQIYRERRVRNQYKIYNYKHSQAEEEHWTVILPPPPRFFFISSAKRVLFISFKIEKKRESNEIDFGECTYVAFNWKKHTFPRDEEHESACDDCENEEIKI